MTMKFIAVLFALLSISFFLAIIFQLDDLKVFHKNYLHQWPPVTDYGEISTPFNHIPENEKATN